MFHSSSQTQARAQTYTSVQLLLEKYWTLFSDKPPKGFGKFFGERSSKPSPKVDNDSSSKSEASHEARDTNKPKRPDKVFEFKSSFGGGQGSDGKKSGDKGNSEREKWFTFGMIGSALAIAAMSYYGYSYQEISWKELTK